MRDMKRIFIGLAACAIFASCQKNEIASTNSQDPSVIGFSTSTGKTKATDNNITTLRANTTGFGVLGTNKSNNAMYINNQAYKYSSGIWAWVGTAVKWPTAIGDYPVNFYAYFPKDVTTLTASASPTFTYSINATPSAQVDVLVAKATGIATRPVSGNVNLAFSHALSKIDFKVVAGKSLNVHVQSVKVRNVEKTSTYSYSSNAWTLPSSKSYTNSYDYRGVVKPAQVITGAANSNETVTTAVPFVQNHANGSFMLMPQSGAPTWVPKPATGQTEATINTKTYIEVVYRITDNAGKDIVGYSKANTHPDYTNNPTDGNSPLFVKVGFPLDATWVNTKSYVYNIFLGTVSSSGGNLTDDTYQDQDGKDTNLDVEEKDITDPINPVDKAIGFEITVNDWDATNPGGNQILQ